MMESQNSEERSRRVQQPQIWIRSANRPSQRKKSIFDQEAVKLQPVVRTSETEAYGVKLGVKEEDNIIVRYKRFKVTIFILLYTNLILYLGTEAYTIIANYKEAQNITPCIPGIIYIILGILVPLLTHNLTFRKRKIDTIEKGRKGSS